MIRKITISLVKTK